MEALEPVGFIINVLKCAYILPLQIRLNVNLRRENRKLESYGIRSKNKQLVHIPKFYSIPALLIPLLTGMIHDFFEKEVIQECVFISLK